MTDLVKGSVARGRAPPPKAHVIKYARGGAVHRIDLYGQSFTCYFSELGSTFKKGLHLKPCALMPVWRDKTKPSSKSVCARQTHTHLYTVQGLQVCSGILDPLLLHTENVATVTLTHAVLRVNKTRACRALHFLVFKSVEISGKGFIQQ